MTYNQMFNQLISPQSSGGFTVIISLRKSEVSDHEK